MPQFLDQTVQKQIREVFSELKYPVHLLFFGTSQKERCEYCAETLQLIREVAALSDLLSVESFDIDADTKQVEKYSVERLPGIVINGKDGDHLIDYGIRLSGLPAGHEFNSLINDILLVSKRESGLSEKTKKALKEINEPVHMFVFATPT